MFPMIDQEVITCEGCDQPVCTRCHPDDIQRCADGETIHCASCSHECPDCAQDRLQAMGVEA